MVDENIDIFTALARPSFFLGIVQEAFIAELFITVLLFTSTGSLLTFFTIIPLHFINVAICNIDDRAYLHLKLFAMTKLKNRNFHHLKVSTY